jgi:hypothetical protein
MVAAIKLYSPSQLKSLAPPIDWIWDGVLATGMVTMVSSRWKQGKTTLVSALLAHLGRGGAFAGSTLKPTRVVVVSEEPPSLWDKRHTKLHFDEKNIVFAPQPFCGHPSRSQWSDMILQFAEEKYGVVVLDPLARFVPGELENRPSLITDVLDEMHMLTEQGTAILMNVHPSKGRERGDFDVRGTGAIAAFADILVKFDRPPHHVDGERIRRLQIESRIDDSETRLLELSADASDYAVVPEEPDASSFASGWPVLKAMLEDSRRAPTRQTLLEGWLEDFEKPSRSTLNRWLERAVKEKLIVRVGSGRQHDAFRYALPGQKVGPAQPSPDEVFAAAHEVLKRFNGDFGE